MANKNTLKVRRRRERRQYDRAMQDFLAYAAKRKALVTFGTTCVNVYGNLNEQCCCHGLEPMAAYSLKQAIEKYTDCTIVPGLIGVSLRLVKKGELPQPLKVEHTHIVKDLSGLDSTLKEGAAKLNCPGCEYERFQPKDTRPYAVVYYDRYDHFFSKGFLQAYRDGALGQLQAIKEVAGLDDQQWDGVVRHISFGFTPNLEKSSSLVILE